MIEYDVMVKLVFATVVIAALVAAIMTWTLNRFYPPEPKWNGNFYLVLEDSTMLGQQMNLSLCYKGWLPSPNGWFLPHGTKVKGIFFPETKLIPAIEFLRTHVQWQEGKELPKIQFYMDYEYFARNLIGKGVLITFTEFICATEDLFCVEMRIHSDPHSWLRNVIIFQPKEAIFQNQDSESKRLATK